MSVTILRRRGTSSEWAAKNPILYPGEEGWDTTLNRNKVGNGVTPWLSLPFEEPKITVATSNSAPYPVNPLPGDVFIRPS